MMPNSLESDIQRAWERAHAILFSDSPDHSGIAEVVRDLRSCLERVKAQDGHGQQELAWLIERLEGRVSDKQQRDFPLS